ncbi:hypothetical protein OC834_007772 [Tilletia horrida]|nr:hypothetical protein OC834_007772 [Tilletia horrida]
MPVLSSQPSPALSAEPSSGIPSCAADYGGDGSELGSINGLVDVYDKYPIWRCHMTRMSLDRRFEYFYDWVTAAAAKLEETESSSKADVIAFLRVLAEAGCSKILDAHSAMNCRIQFKFHREEHCSHHSCGPSSEIQENATSPLPGNEHQGAAHASSISTHTIVASSPLPDKQSPSADPSHPELVGDHTHHDPDCVDNIIDDDLPCPGPSSSSASLPAAKRRRGIANARKLSGSGQKWVRGQAFSRS